MLILLPLLAPLAHATCVLDLLEASPGRKGHQDLEAVFYVEEGKPDCSVVELRAPLGATLESLKVKVRHADDTGPRLGLERVVPGVPSSLVDRPWLLHLPELRFGDTVKLKSSWSGLPEGTLPSISWQAPEAPSPALDFAEGAAVQGGLIWPLPPVESGSLPGSPSSWTSAELRGDPGADEAEVLRLEEVWRLEGFDTTTPLTDARTGQTALVLTRTERVLQPHTRVLPAPPGAEGTLACAAIIEPPAQVEVEAEACLVTLGEAHVGRELRLESSWIAGGLPTSLRWQAHGPATVAHHALQVQTGGEEAVSLVASEDTGPAGEATHLWGISPDQALPGDGWAVLPDATYALRLGAVGSRQVIPTRQALLDDVAFYAILVSLPEPALPTRLKNRDVDDAAISDVYDLMREQVQAGTWPGASPLRPRKLVRGVRRSGWGTPWEQALFLGSYLRQLKVEAVPVPVRPAAWGALAIELPDASPYAVVRVVRDGAVSWFDPGCDQCAPGELRPWLHGATLLSAEHEGTVPDAAPGRMEVRQDARGGATVRLEGYPALLVREHLAAVPTAQRSAWLATWFGAARLVSQEGLGQRGAPVSLVFEGLQAGQEASLVPWPVVSPEGPKTLVPGPPLVLRWTAAEGLALEGKAEVPGLRWERRILPRGGVEETLERSAPTLSRDELVRLQSLVAEVLTPPVEEPALEEPGLEEPALEP